MGHAAGTRLAGWCLAAVIQLRVARRAELLQLTYGLGRRNLREVTCTERDAHEDVPESLCGGELGEAEVGERLFSRVFAKYIAPNEMLPMTYQNFPAAVSKVFLTAWTWGD